MLFEGGGTIGVERRLAGLMKAEGKVMPKSWKDGWHWKNHSQATYDAKCKAMEEFKRQNFKLCKPVVVEIKRR
jgi:hypothetical protein